MHDTVFRAIIWLWEARNVDSQYRTELIAHRHENGDCRRGEETCVMLIYYADTKALERKRLRTITKYPIKAEIEGE